MAEHNLFVYIIRSVPHPDRCYTGLTDNIQRRLECTTAAVPQHTAPLRPWSLVAAIQFTNPESAVAFEQYLKSGSGRAFSKRHFK